MPEEFSSPKSSNALPARPRHVAEYKNPLLLAQFEPERWEQPENKRKNRFIRDPG